MFKGKAKTHTCCPKITIQELANHRLFVHTVHIWFRFQTSSTFPHDTMVFSNLNPYLALIRGEYSTNRNTHEDINPEFCVLV